MKFYVSLVIKKENKIIKEILNKKYGIGLAILMFSKYSLKREKNIYYYKNSIQEAMLNLKSAYNLVKYSKKEDSFYNANSLELINTIQDELYKLYEELKQYEESKDIYVFADYSPILSLYKDKNLNPIDEIVEYLRYIKLATKGEYSSTYITKKENEIMGVLKSQIMRDLSMLNTSLKFSSEGYAHEPIMIKVGEDKIMKFLIDIKVEDKVFVKYPSIDEYMIVIREILNSHNLGYELERSSSSANKLNRGILQVWLVKIIKED